MPTMQVKLLIHLVINILMDKMLTFMEMVIHRRSIQVLEMLVQL